MPEPKIGDTVISAIGARCKVIGIRHENSKTFVDTDICVYFDVERLRLNDAGEWVCPSVKKKHQ